MLLTAILAADSAPKGGGGAGLLIMLPLLMLMMYFLVIRPQKKRMRETQALAAALQEGDEVLTTGGVFGFVNAIDGDVIWLDIADNVEIRVLRTSIARRIDPTKEAAGGELKAALPDAGDVPVPDADEKK